MYFCSVSISSARTMEVSPSIHWSSILCRCTALLFLFRVSASAIVFVNEIERLALLHFKSKITSDPNRVLSSWNDSVHFCQWRGVNCTREMRVTSLDLRSQSLVGTLSPSLPNLTFLRVIDLRNNRFLGRIPPEFGKLTRLQYLILSYNRFEGEIPAKLRGCSNLKALTLLGNGLEGHILFAAFRNLLSHCHPPKLNLLLQQLCACQAIWLNKILKLLHLEEDGPTQIYCDNNLAIKLSRNPVLHGRSKHIDVKYHFLRDLTNDGVINLIYCKSENQIADI